MAYDGGPNVTGRVEPGRLEGMNGGDVALQGDCHLNFLSMRRFPKRFGVQKVAWARMTYAEKLTGSLTFQKQVFS